MQSTYLHVTVGITPKAAIRSNTALFVGISENSPKCKHITFRFFVNIQKVNIQIIANARQKFIDNHQPGKKSKDEEI